MKKFLLTALLAVGISSLAHAQFFKFGARGGIHTADVKGTDLLVFDQNSLDSLSFKADNANLGFRIGVIGRFTFANIVYVQPELVFRSSKNNYRFNSLISGVGDELRSETFFNVDIPVLAGVKLGPFRAQAGPVASLLLSKNSDFTDKDNLERDFKRAEWSYQAGIGIDIGKKLGLDINYQDQITDDRDYITVGSGEYLLSAQEKYWVFALSLFF